MNLSELLRRPLASVPEPERVALMAELGRMIANRIRAVEMWDQPPEYFGYPEFRHWREAYPADFESRAFDYASASPTLDFFAERFAQALDAGGPLNTVLDDGGDVFPYVAVMIGNFLTDRQRTNDPVGYRVFKNLEAVVQGLELAGTAILSGLHDRKSKPGRVRRATQVRFTTPTGPSPTAPLLELLLAADSLRGSLHKLSKLGTGAQRLLGLAVAALPGAGVSSFEFGELLVPLQTAVRDAVRVWVDCPTAIPALGVLADGEIISREIRKSDSRSRYQTLNEHFDVVRREVRAAIDTGNYQDRTRNAMCCVLDDWFAHLAAAGADGDAHPPLDDWARQLGVKRSTLWDHLERLRGIIRQALARIEATGR